MKEENIFGALLDPNRVFNAEEKNFKLYLDKSKILPEKDTNNVY